MQQDSDLLTGTKAIAAFMGMTPRQCQHKIDKGIIPSFKLPGSKLQHARRSTLTAWLTECEQASRKAKPLDTSPMYATLATRGARHA